MKKAERLAAFWGMAAMFGGLDAQINRAVEKLSLPADGRKEFCYPSINGRTLFTIMAVNQESADAQYAKIAKKKNIVVRPRIPADEFRHLMFCNSDVKDINGLQVIVFEGRYVQLQKCTDDKIMPNDVWYNPVTFEISIMDETETGTESDPNNLGGYKLISIS